MRLIKWIKWFFDFDRENESLNKQAKYQIDQLSKEPHIIEFFETVKKKKMKQPEDEYVKYLEGEQIKWDEAMSELDIDRKLRKEKIEKMKTLEEEAELYSTMTTFYNVKSGEIPTENEIMRDEYVSEIAFKAGAKSKWAQSEKIKAQIEVLKEVLKECEDDYIFTLLRKKEQQLKELEE